MAGPRTSIRAQPRDALMGDCDAVVEKVVFSLGLYQVVNSIAHDDLAIDITHHQ
jgi:hypothetical protein